ncbi:hypothetical protein [Burkholderia latens]|uniref:hypothetical protein n=1 Tax=Burkholderia latens TaxID=488446 RepID=UPI0018D23942|nr:hypothetical protein [Burkholderia latens]
MDAPTLPALRAELDALNIELARVRAQEKKAALAAFKGQVALDPEPELVPVGSGDFRLVTLNQN